MYNFTSRRRIYDESRIPIPNSPNRRGLRVRLTACSQCPQTPRNCEPEQSWPRRHAESWARAVRGTLKHRVPSTAIRIFESGLGSGGGGCWRDSGGRSDPPSAVDWWPPLGELILLAAATLSRRSRRRGTPIARLPDPQVCIALGRWRRCCALPPARFRCCEPPYLQGLRLN